MKAVEIGGSVGDTNGKQAGMTMRYSDTFAKAVRQAVGDRSTRQVGRLCGLDETTIHRMVAYGKLVRRETLAAFCDGLNVEGRARAELFRLAGMVELVERSEAGAGR